MPIDRQTAMAAARQAYAKMARAGAPLCQIVSDDELRDPLAVVDGPGWLGGNIHGWRVLCLAGGGGRQSCLYAAAGADVTVVDLSADMLDLDRQAARARGYSIRLIEGSMDDLSMLAPESFDLVVHPVSTCYLPQITTVFTATARVLRSGGIYISQHKAPVSLQASPTPSSGQHGGAFEIRHGYYDSRPVPEPEPGAVAARLREPGAMEFVHRLEEIFGGLCRNGFIIDDVIEPDHREPNAAIGSFAHRAAFVAPYLRIKAIRRPKGSGIANASTTPTSLWIPDP
ncbi:MAG: class I SAM-dependent methyltransferase [Planctomycetota bacterium]